MNESTGPTASEFLITKEYRRFAEFCDACRRERYIGLCYGPPGVGKTLSARHYAQWDMLAPVLRSQRTSLAALCEPAVADCRCLFYTPAVTVTPKQLTQDLQGLLWDLKLAVEGALNPEEGTNGFNVHTTPDRAELLLIDEADRLKMQVLEQLRDIYDRGAFGVVLIGMPGLEKRLARYAQLYSRVGFVHQFRALSAEELQFILTHKWQQLGLTLSPDDFTDAEAIAAIARITGGNFRLVQRLFTQMERILRINQLHSVTKEVVETARETLVIGAT
jgi:DNA transposition AAA+ family ATPase